MLLLDEPFSALDPRTRNAARRVLRAIYFERRFTVLQVTHDFAEAGLLGDVAIMLDRGRVVQQGDPEEVFRKPASPYIADFLGAENVFAGTARPDSRRGAGLVRDADEERVRRARRRVHDRRADVLRARRRRARPAHAVIRAEEVSLSVEPSMSSMQNQFRGRIVEIVPAGALTRVTVDAAERRSSPR